MAPRTHTSALYELEIGGRGETQSSSGVIVSTGLGSTAWMKSLVTGAASIARQLKPGEPVPYFAHDWDSEELRFAVREPFPRRASRAELIYGPVTRGQLLKLRLVRYPTMTGLRNCRPPARPGSTPISRVLP
jgi:hypothetical protein